MKKDSHPKYPNPWLDSAWVKSAVDYNMEDTQFIRQYLNEVPSRLKQVLSRADELIHFFRSNNIHTFNIRIFKGCGVLIIELKNIFSLSNIFLEELRHLRPVSMGIYFRNNGYIRDYRVEEITLPKHSYPDIKGLTTLEYLLNPPNSVKFIMED